VSALLIVFGGLPGTGKTTLARRIAEERRATYLRIDTIEQALVASGRLGGDIGPVGYIVAYELARANLRLGGTVVADSVNPLAITRDAWREVAATAPSRLAEVEVVCSEPTEHRRRVEDRAADIPGHVQPTWAEVIGRDYEPWDRPRIVVDTAHRPVSATLDELRSKLP
jgi:predicted kinase